MGFLDKLKKFVDSNRISLYTISGVIAGFIAGLLVKRIFWSTGQQVDPYLLRYLSLPGIIYIRIFFLLIIPLLISSLSTSFLSSEDDKSEAESSDHGINIKKLLLVTFVFFVCFSTFASVLGISIIAIGKPGITRNVTEEVVKVNESVHEHLVAMKKRIEQSNYQTDSIYNIILSIFPENLISPMFMNSFTSTTVTWPSNLSQIMEPDFVPDLKQQITYSYKANMLGICAISLLLGLLLQELGPEKTAGIRQLLRETEILVRTSMEFLLKLMPLGMFCWMFAEAMKMHSITQVAIQLVHFYALAFLSFFILIFIFYPLIYFIFTRENPFLLYSNIISAILVAIGSISSAITLPMTMQCMDKIGLSKPIAQTVLPLGMTIHMNGTAMYYPMVAIFVAQMKCVPVDAFSIGILSLFSVVMSMGLPGAPAGGSVIVNHIAFAAVIGVDNPQDVLAYILAFEWIMERIRTPVNIMGDCVVAKCIEKLLVHKKTIKGLNDANANEMELL